MEKDLWAALTEMRDFLCKKHAAAITRLTSFLPLSVHTLPSHLMQQISPPALDEGLLVALTYITSIGCSLSATACLLAICLYCCSR